METMTPQITRGCSWNPPTLSLVVVDKYSAVCAVRLSLSVDLHRHTHTLQACDLPPNATPNQVQHSQTSLNSQYPQPKPNTPRRV